MFQQNPTVLVAGFVGKRFLLLTKDLYVFDVSKDYLDEMKNLLELTEPKALEEKYPNLFQLIQKQNQSKMNGVLLSDNESDWLSLILNDTLVNFDLKNKIIINKTLNFNVNNKAFISASTMAGFYVAKLNYDNSTEMGKFGFYYNQTLITSIRYSNRIALIGEFKKICKFIKNNFNNAFFVENNFINENLLQQNCVQAFNFIIKTGFITKNKIYLFDNVNVYIMNKAMFQNNRPFTFIRKRMDHFFICSSQVNSFGKISNLNFNFIL